MRRLTRFFLPIAGLALVAACSDGDRSSPTGPGVPRFFTGQAPTLEELQEMGRVLFPTGLEVAAAAHIATIDRKYDDGMGNVLNARQRMMILVRFTLQHRGALEPVGDPAARDLAMLEFIRALYAFVGLDPGAGIPAASGGDQAIAVVDASGGLVEAEFAGVDIPAGALNEPALIVVTRLPDPTVPREGPLPGSRFDEYPLFYDFAVLPSEPLEPGAHFFFNVPVRVGVCQVEDPSSPFYPPEEIHDRLRLAHPDPFNPTELEIPPKADVSDFLSCAGATVITPPPPSLGLLDDAWRSLGRVASHAAALFTPNTAYAGHGGLGSLSTSFSPWGAVDPLSGETPTTIFRATFDNETVGAAPTAPEIGSWSQDAPAGRIIVREAVGDLTAQPVELTQFDQLTGSLRLIGNVAGTPPASGTWDATWRSVAADPGVFFAPVVIRDSQGLIVASLEYRPEGLFTYNNLPVPIRWTPGVSQQFTIRVDLATKTTRLLMNGTLVEGAQNLPFYQPTAANIARIGFELGGTFAQRFGWDDISIAPTAVIE